MEEIKKEGEKFCKSVLSGSGIILPSLPTLLLEPAGGPCLKELIWFEGNNITGQNTDINLINVARKMGYGIFQHVKSLSPILSVHGE